MREERGNKSEGIGARLKSPQSEAGIHQKLLYSGKKIILYNLALLRAVAVEINILGFLLR